MREGSPFGEDEVLPDCLQNLLLGRSVDWWFWLLLGLERLSLSVDRTLSRKRSRTRGMRRVRREPEPRSRKEKGKRAQEPIDKEPKTHTDEQQSYVFTEKGLQPEKLQPANRQALKR